jgi:hypothetical protein
MQGGPAFFAPLLGNNSFTIRGLTGPEFFGVFWIAIAMRTLVGDLMFGLSRGLQNFFMERRESSGLPELTKPLSKRR